MEGSDEIRCFHCQKLLAKGEKGLNTYEIKCTRCGSVNALFNGIPDQVIITDPSGVILYANAQVEKITGYSISEILGKKPSLWGNQMPAAFYKKMWDSILNKKKSVTVKITNKKKDGTLYQAQLRISPVLNSEGEIKMFVGMETVIE